MRSPHVVTWPSPWLCRATVGGNFLTPRWDQTAHRLPATTQPNSRHKKLPLRSPRTVTHKRRGSDFLPQRRELPLSHATKSCHLKSTDCPECVSQFGTIRFTVNLFYLSAFGCNLCFHLRSPCRQLYPNQNVYQLSQGRGSRPRKMESNQRFPPPGIFVSTITFNHV